MAHQDSRGRGSLVIDLRFPELGRLKRASGTGDARMHAHYVAMCRALYDGGRLDVLRSLMKPKADGGATFAEVWDLYRPMKGRAAADLSRLPSPETQRRLFAVDDVLQVGTPADDGAFGLWVRSQDVADVTRKNLQRDARAVAKMATAGTLRTVKVEDVPALVERLRMDCLTSKPPRRSLFNHARVTALAFLKAMVGRAHHLYGAVLETPALKHTPKPGRPLEPAEARDYCAELDRVTPGVGRAFWAMCCTGMGPDEYWGCEWRVESDRVRIDGRKRRARVRDIPVVDRAVLIGGPHATRATTIDRVYQLGLGPATSSGTRRRLDGTLVRKPSPFPTAWPVKHTLYDARRTFAHWMAQAGIERARRIAYMGHAGVGSMTDLYERHEVERHLLGDAAKLRTYLGITDGPALALLKAGA